MDILEQYPQNADLTIYNTFYQYGIKNEETGKRMDDFLILVWKDNTTGAKRHIVIKKPNYTFYMAKPGVDCPHNVLFIDKDKVDPVTCQYSKIEKCIAEKTNNLDFYNECLSACDRENIKKLHALPNVFSSDMNIEDFYRLQFSKKFTNNITKLNKSFFDIEVDGKDAVGDFVQMGECPINAIAFFDEKHNEINQYLLRNNNNPLISQYESDIKSGKISYNDMMEFITKAVGGWKQIKRYGLNTLNIKIHFFDNEIELLSNFFRTVHSYGPDFIEGWNSSAFDLEYIITRIGNLGYDPADIMCDQSWEIKVVKNYVDQKNLSSFAARNDYCFISGNTVWVDQMLNYASIRKAKIGSFKSFKLDDIGELTAGVNKLDYSDITDSVVMLPWLDFKVFSFYNLMDVIAQKCIEAKTQDLEYIFTKALINNTVYKKVHKQTIYLTNRMTKDFDKLGYIIGNNCNKWNERGDKFLGALVNDPTHTNAYSKLKINGVPIRICENLQDYDYKSLYPSIILKFNIAPNTQIGRIDIDDKVYDNENAYMNSKYSRGGEFVENMVTDNLLEFYKRWFHLAGINEFLIDIKEYYEKVLTQYGNNYFAGEFGISENGILLIHPVKDISITKTINPIEFDNRLHPFVILSDIKHSEVKINGNS